MRAPLYVAPSMSVQLPPEPASPSGEVADLLRQVVELQREQLNLLKAHLAAQDSTARWKTFLTRWSDEFPDLAGGCREAFPVMERTYLALVRELTERLQADAGGDLENEFALGEFLDRYGIRLGQLGAILSQLGPLAEAAAKIDEPAGP